MKIKVKNEDPQGYVEAESIVSFNGGDSHIIIDDGCYVIVNWVGPEPDDIYGMSSWIFPEALEVLKNLPKPRGY